MQKKKIIYLVTKDDVGGAQKYVRDLCGHIDKAAFEAVVVTGGKKIRFLSNAFLPYFLFINDWLAIGELVLFFKKERPDIVHLNSSKAGVVGAVAAKIAGVPKVVFTAHGWVFNPDSDLSFLRRCFYILLHKIAAQFQDVIINVSAYDRQLALKHHIADARKLVTIHNGLEEVSFFDKRTARKALAQLSGAALPTGQAGLPMNGTWIGSVGRLVTEKNYPAFIEAAALVENKEAVFFIIGSGDNKKRFLEKIKSAGLTHRFFIIDNCSPAAAYLKAFDIFVLSSIKEGLPYTLLEAMAAGLPVVVTRVGGMTEVIDPVHGTKRGLAMPPREPEELARAINHFLTNPEEAAALAKEANKFLKSDLALAGMIERTEKVYY